MKIIDNTENDNSTRNRFLKDLTIAFAECDLAFLEKSFSEDMIWTLVGLDEIHSRADFLDYVQKKSATPPLSVTLNRVFSHGIHGAVNCVMEGGDGKKWEFADFYEFISEKEHTVTRIRSLAAAV